MRPRTERRADKLGPTNSDPPRRLAVIDKRMAAGGGLLATVPGRGTGGESSPAPRQGCHETVMGLRTDRHLGSALWQASPQTA